ncbi:hypothetical protein AGMMS49975_10080 [Clostridia bacterium]|nr:hypothetical protein AGMMS49975_10080 [Clostridia bacterium]
MGKLVLNLGTTIRYYLLENYQLLYAADLDPQNISEILDKIGDYPIDEICVYMKFDTRQDLAGVQLDHIITDYLDLVFRITQSDYDTMKAIAHRFRAKRLSFYSAYRHYAAMVSDGVVVDSYGEHQHVVIGLQDGKHHSINVCVSEKLQRAIETCNMMNIIYASYKTVPELKNIDTIPTEYYESVAFLQHIMYGSPCYSVDIESGEVFEYGDVKAPPRFYELSPEEWDVALDEIRKNLTPPTVTKRRVLSIDDVKVGALCLVAGLLMGTAIYAAFRIGDNNTALQAKASEQNVTIKRLDTESRFLADSVDNPDGGKFYDRVVSLSGVIKSGTVMSVRFYMDTIELTIFVTDALSAGKVKAELASAYEIMSFISEGQVTNGDTGILYQQYNAIIK